MGPRTQQNKRQRNGRHYGQRGVALEISGPEPFLPFSHAHAEKAEKDALLETWTEL
jgi:hypothetical protein